MAKEIPPLNARQIEAWKPAGHRQELADGKVPGLRARLSPAGKISWSLSVNLNGVRRRFDIGSGHGLAEARRRAEVARRQVSDGVDPAAAKHAARQRARDAAAGLGTLGSVVRAYFENGPGAALKSGAAQRAHIEVVFRAHLERASNDATPGSLQLAIDAWPSRSSGAHAAAYIRPLARWASKRGLMAPGFEALEAPALAADGATGQRVLDREETGRLLAALDSQGHDGAARFMLLTGARRGEVCGATWGEIDLTTRQWTITAARRKDTRPVVRRRRRAEQDHVIGLSRQAVALLQGMDCGDAMSLVFPGDRGATLVNWPRWTTRQKAKLGISGVTPHTLRRTCATLAGDCGAPPHVISALLGHRAIGGSLVAGYSAARYTGEVAGALQRVGDLTEALAAGRENVSAMVSSIGNGRA
ncbi:tyrosine-type recombinase/integrase [Bosea sp. PAMC 26642]|uniref:tyrosine-type recombinase/integrase n=1 Tax=Bosea sp. (strain PAMC 26642) TaxID=1792307 RepID=UPI0007705128|nr:tyrosine-type recombinase/integrase [Bosea sp. PAMC 26642]AMJ59021.1 hypothetical protein AXW83_00750 [Bosea sp. PAMC 26642]